MRDLDLPESFRKRIAAQIETQVEKGKRSMPWHEAVDANESLHPIFINIRINDTILIDRFEVRFVCLIFLYEWFRWHLIALLIFFCAFGIWKWDLSNSKNSPELFANVLCEELVRNAMNRSLLKLYPDNNV